MISILYMPLLLGSGIKDKCKTHIIMKVIMAKQVLVQCNEAAVHLLERAFEGIDHD